MLQHFLQLAFDAAARLVQFGVVSCRPVAHTLRTPIRKLRLHVDSLHSTGAKRASERTLGGHEVVLLGNLNGYEFRDAPGISQRVDDVLGGQFAHDECQIALERCLDRASINPLHVFRDASTTNHFHDKFCILHSSPVLPGSSAEKESLHR